METRNITIISSNNNAQYNIQSNTTTLGELKQDLTANNISYAGMTFYEGFTKTELVSDDSVLPSNINRRGVITNDLVFMLTPERKNIKSGAMTRQECYTYCKQHPEFVKKVKTATNKHYTNLSTSQLTGLIEGEMSIKKSSAPNKPKKEKQPTQKECSCKEEENNIIQAILVIADTLTVEKRDKVYTLLNQPVPKRETKKVKSYSSQEINEMFGFIKK